MKNKLNTFVSGLTILALVGLVMPASLVSAAPSEFISGSASFASMAEFASDELVVKYKNDKKPFRVVRLPQGTDIAKAVAEYKKKADVEYAEPNYIVRAFFVPNDTYYSYQWHLDNAVYGGIDTETAWDTSRGAGVTVAVIDTGVAYENFDTFKQAPDLAGTAFAAGYDFVNNDSHPNDDNGHGTHVAGTVAQTTNNSLGVAGVAFEATVMPVKVLNKSGSGTHTQVANGIYFAADNGAKVINLSLGGSFPSQTLLDAVAYAYSKGVTIVAAAGNDGSSIISYPAAYDNYVIAVGATRYDETLAYYSNYGASLDLVAPGGDLRVDQNGDGYGDGVLQQTFGRRVDQFGYYFYQGTSMASPHAAGVAALVISNGVSGPNNVRAALETSAEDKGVAGWDATYGWGLVDAAAALTYVPAPVDNPPSISVTSPLDGALVSGATVAITAAATDDVGVASVDFYIDGVLLSSDVISPYEAVWDSTTVSDGSHSITATAIDTASQTASDTVSVFVDNINNPPVADAGTDQTISDTDGNGTESVALNGSNSYDPDGVIISYEWKEGATILGATATTTVNFAVGLHTVTLTVVDNDGAASSDDVVVTVLANASPIANAGSDKSDSVGDSVSFDGSGSTDDGTIVSYEWDFGDGATASGIAVSHAYSAEGTYTVTLTVTDNGGLSASDTATVSITTPPPTGTTASVDSLSYAPWGGKESNLHLAIKMALVDNLGNAVSGATVSVDLNRDGSLYAAMTGTTDSVGQVTFKALKIPSGCYETVVTAVTASGLTWDGITPVNSYCK